MAVKIRGERVQLRALTEEDLDRVEEILTTPEISRWWGDAEDEAAGLIDTGDDATTGYAIELDDEIVGVIQGSEELTENYRHASIDIAVDPAWHGKGIATEAIHALATYLIKQRGHHRLTIDPAADNKAAISVYTKLGFKPVGIMRHYECGPDGEWRDGLLMDLLAHELVDL